MMGSVAERILRESPVPVLTVRGDSPAPGETLRLPHVLCAVDNSAASRRALAWVSRIARCFGSRVTVLHVHLKDASNAIEDLAAWIPAGMSRDCPLECVVREGEPADQIVALAHELRTGMLVIGTQHRLFHGASVIGTTTAMAVRHAPCPVLTVIGPATEGS
jgi:nucleotide-binding universal stress UspA family protein